MKISEMQKLRADDRARIEHGHVAVDVNILGEPGADSGSCTCGKRCMYDSPECRGRTTVFMPGVIVEVHLCAVHLVRAVESKSLWRDPPSIEMAMLSGLRVPGLTSEINTCSRDKGCQREDGHDGLHMSRYWNGQLGDEVVEEWADGEAPGGAVVA